MNISRSNILLIIILLFLLSLFLTWESSRYIAASSDEKMQISVVESEQNWGVEVEPNGNIFNFNRELNQHNEENVIPEPQIDLNQDSYQLLAITEIGSVQKALFLIKDQRRLVAVGNDFPPFGVVESIDKNQIVISDENGKQFTWSLFPVPSPESKEETPSS